MSEMNKIRMNVDDLNELIKSIDNEDNKHYDSMFAAIAEEDISNDTESIIQNKFGEFEYRDAYKRSDLGSHDQVSTVLYFKDHDQYFKTHSYYSSYNGADFWSEFKEVKPKEITKTIYE